MDYKRAYYKLFGAIADCLELLRSNELVEAEQVLMNAQKETEDMYMKEEQAPLTLHKYAKTISLRRPRPEQGFICQYFFVMNSMGLFGFLYWKRRRMLEKSLMQLVKRLLFYSRHIRPGNIQKLCDFPLGHAFAIHKPVAKLHHGMLSGG